MLGMKCEADEVKSTDRKTASTIDVDVSFLKTDDVDALSLRDVPDDGTLGCRETLHIELKDAQARKSLDPTSCLVCATRPGSCSVCSRIRSAGGIISCLLYTSDAADE